MKKLSMDQFDAWKLMIYVYQVEKQNVDILEAMAVLEEIVEMQILGINICIIKCEFGDYLYQAENGAIKNMTEIPDDFLKGE